MWAAVGKRSGRKTGAPVGARSALVVGRDLLDQIDDPAAQLGVLDAA